MDNSPMQSSVEYNRLNQCLTSIMDIGELLLMHGAEVSRVEDTIMRLCRAYGFMRADVFTITSSIVATVRLANGISMTQTRRIRERDTDLGIVEAVNALSRKVCLKLIPQEKLAYEIDKIKMLKRGSMRLNLSMYMLISASLAIFFGGNLRDGLAASLSGIVLYFMLSGSAALKLNSIVQTMICSAVTAMAVFFLVKIGIGIHSDKIMIGNIMLVIPGIQLTNSLRDMMNGDMISGLLNMSEALLKAISVAMGFAVILLIGGY